MKHDESSNVGNHLARLGECSVNIESIYPRWRTGTPICARLERVLASPLLSLTVESLSDPHVVHNFIHKSRENVIESHFRSLVGKEMPIHSKNTGKRNCISFRLAS